MFKDSILAGNAVFKNMQILRGGVSLQEKDDWGQALMFYSPVLLPVFVLLTVLLRCEEVMNRNCIFLQPWGGLLLCFPFHDGLHLSMCKTTQPFLSIGCFWSGI